MRVEYLYGIGDEVKIIPISMVGIIDGLSTDNNGEMYRVVYWNDGCRYSQWVYAWEIELKNRRLHE